MLQTHQPSIHPVTRRKQVAARTRAMACALCLVIMTTAGIEASRAEEASDISLAPLRDDQHNLRGIVSAVQLLGEMQWKSYALPTYSNFQIIMPSLTGVGLLSQSGIAIEQGDEAALMRFVLAAIKSRVQELGVSDEIAVRYPDSWSDEGTGNCDQLRVSFEIQSREIELMQGRATVVVMTMVSRQGVRELRGSSDCSRYPPRTLRDASRIFVLEDRDRERALDAIRRELLSMIDGAMVGRIAASNYRALKMIHGWTASDN
jgi:hypothetical protein